MRLEFAIKKDRAKQRQVGGLALGGGDNAAERIGGLEVALVDVRGIKKNIGQRGTAAEGRLRAELGQNQFFDRIIKKSPAGADAGFAIAAKQLAQHAAAEVRTVSQAEAWSEGLVISGSHSSGHSGITRNDQSRGLGTRICAGGIRNGVRCKSLPIVLATTRDSARIYSGILSRPEGFNVTADIGRWRREFPAQAVVESQIGFDLPTVLNEGINRCAANVLALAGALRVAIGEPKKELGILIAVAGKNRVWSAIVECVLAVDVEIIELVEAGAADIGSKLYRVTALHPGKLVGPLKAVSHLRQKTLKIIAEGCAARDAYKRNSGEVCGQPRRNAEIWIGAESGGGGRNRGRVRGSCETKRSSSART